MGRKLLSADLEVHRSDTPCPAKSAMCEPSAAATQPAQSHLSKSHASLYTACPMPKIEDIAGDLYDFLQQQRSNWQSEAAESVTPFNSLASASIRGDAGCSQPECRALKLGVLARYAATYADHVYLPVPLSRPTGESVPEQFREANTRDGLENQWRRLP